MLKGAAPQAAPADLIKDSDQTKFAKDVLEASRTVPVIVDFWAPWCGPVQELQPTIEKVVKAAKGAVKLVKINIDQNQMLAQQLRIQSIPAVYAFFGGRPVDGFMGAVPESQVKQFVDRLIQATGGAGRRSGGRRARRAARACQGGGGAERLGPRRAQIYSEILGVEPDNVAGARRPGALPRRRRATLEQAKELLGQVPAKDKTNADVVAVQAAIDLAEKAKEAGPVDDLKAKAAADPKDFQARLDLAHGLLGRRPAPGGDRRAARHDQGRPQLERGSRAPAAAEVLRGAGLHRSARRRRPQAAVDHPVLLTRRVMT